jgi:hypothetical protein
MKKNHVFERISARKYYGSHATGSVLLVNGQVHTHAKTPEVRRMYRDLVKEQKEQEQAKVYVVATTQNDGEDDNFRDIVLITRSKPRAQRLTKKLQSGKKIRGLDNLMDYENATWFEKTLEDLSCWKIQD